MSVVADRVRDLVARLVVEADKRLRHALGGAEPRPPLERMTGGGIPFEILDAPSQERPDDSRYTPCDATLWVEAFLLRFRLEASLSRSAEVAGRVTAPLMQAVITSLKRPSEYGSTIFTLEVPEKWSISEHFESGPDPVARIIELRIRVSYYR